MMQSLVVYLDGVLCGELRQSLGGDLRFEYDDGYVALPDPTPLSLSMPVSIREHRRRTVLPFLQGLLPDNPTALRALAKVHGVSERNPFALLSRMGADVAGALQILPPDQSPTDGPGPASYAALTVRDVEAALDSVVQEYQQGVGMGVGEVGRFSLAGAQPKIALFRDEAGRWGHPASPTPTTHIIKPVTGDLPLFDVTEWMTMRAALHLGLTVADCEITEFGAVRAFVTSRYDRVVREGVWHRLHQEDLAQSLAVSPEKKYQHRDGGPGVGSVAQLLRGLGNAQDRRAVAQSFFTGLMFNVIVQNTDAHVKNYSVMLQGAGVSLAPLYDLATIAPYVGAGVPTHSAMKIGNEYSFSRITLKDCLAAARTLGLEEGWAAECVEGLRGGVLDAFGQAREDLVAAPVNDARVTRFADALVGSVQALPLVR